MANTGALGTPGATQSGGSAAASPFSATTSNLLASPSWTNEVSGYLAGQAAPSLAQGGLASALGDAALANVGPQLGTSAAEAESTTGFDLANALLGQKGIGLQQQALGAQAATAGQQQGLEQAQYQVQSGQYPEQLQEAALQNQNAVIGNRDAAAIGGTTDTTSNQRTQATQAANYGWQTADIYRSQQLAQLGQQSEQIGYGGQQEQTANQANQLALAAQQQGLTGEQAQSQLGFGLQQLGVNASPESLVSAVSAGQATGSSSLAALLSQAALTGGLGPNFGG